MPHIDQKYYSFFVHLLLTFLISVTDVTDCFIFVNKMPTTTSSPSSSSSPTSVIFVETTLLSGSGKEDTMYESNSNDNTMTIPNDPRSCILRVGANAGKLCYLANEMITSHANGDSSKKLFCDGSDDKDIDKELILALTELFISLWLTSQSLKLNWIYSIRSKMKLNAKKYPVEHCKGKAGKYTQYSHLTGITTTNQSTVPDAPDASNNTNTSLENINHNKVITLDEFINDHLELLCCDITVFAEEREWIKYHKPRNLIMAMLGEVGELSELLQYDGDDEYDENDNDTNELLLIDRLQLDENSKKKDKLSQELADVTIYALRLVTVCNVIQPLKESLQQKQQQQS
jgi:NTP pyrophosphatase (non-canonical NTP hydrolase)